MSGYSYSAGLVILLGLCCLTLGQEEEERLNTEKTLVASAVYAIVDILTYPFSEIGHIIFGIEGKLIYKIKHLYNLNRLLFKIKQLKS